MFHFKLGFWSAAGWVSQFYQIILRKAPCFQQEARRIKSKAQIYRKYEKQLRFFFFFTTFAPVKYDEIFLYNILNNNRLWQKRNL
jgi:hypothetical protein